MWLEFRVQSVKLITRLLSLKGNQIRGFFWGGVTGSGGGAVRSHWFCRFLVSWQVSTVVKERVDPSIYSNAVHLKNLPAEPFQSLTRTSQKEKQTLSRYGMK